MVQKIVIEGKQFPPFLKEVVSLLSETGSVKRVGKTTPLFRKLR
ncbi:MAG: hypothetical protein N2053_02590 [Chitinispirillaceae bacterium]|nr:hypothetical protein [Chitinispirillaceae bacterium]